MAFITAFVAGSWIVSMEISARAMAAGVAVLRNTWLHNWDVDSTSLTKVTSIPFQDTKLSRGLDQRVAAC